MLFNFQKNTQLMVLLKPLMPMLFCGVLFAVLAGVFGLFALWCIIQLIAGGVLYWLVFAALSWFAVAVFSALSAWLAHCCEAQFSAKLKRQLAAHLARLPAHQFANYKNENLKRLLGEDVTALHHLVAHLPSEIANLLILPCITTILLFTETQLIALVVLLPGLLAAICYLVIVPKLTAKQATVRFDVMAAITKTLNDYCYGATVYRIYATESGPLALFKHAVDHFIHSVSSRVKRVATVVAYATAMLQAVATFSIAYVVGSHWPTEELAALLFFSLAMVAPALKLGHGLDYVRAGKSAAYRIEDFLAKPQIPFGQHDQLPHLMGSLVVDQLSVQSIPQLKKQKISFSVSSNTLLAISGKSGVGKSTLLRVLAGFEPSYLGTIAYQGVNCSTLSEEAWSALVMLLPQKLSVLDASVKENLVLTEPNATDQQYLNALEKAQLYLPLSHSATLLSGGEKQRLHLARVFLSQATMILLDEPTSALDELTAAACIEELKHHAYTQHKIIIMVTHDYKLAGYANKHLCLQEDGLREEAS